MTNELPFKDIRVLELGTVIAGPFSGSLFADMGAEVIKIEAPDAPDALRRMGLNSEGTSLWWGVASRAKKCITLNLKSEKGKELFTRLVRGADVMIENYRPGVLDRLGLSWQTLHELNPRLVLLSISGFGQVGLESRRPGFGKIAEGLSGLITLTGDPAKRPLFVGFSLADTCAGLLGTYAAAVALYYRDVNGGKGAHIDLALYEALLRMLDTQLAVAKARNKIPTRQGTSNPYGWGIDDPEAAEFVSLQCQSGEWFALHLPERKIALSLLRTAASADLRADLAALAKTLSADALRQRIQQAGGAIVPVLDGMSAANNAYLRARGDVVAVDDALLGKICVPGPIIKPDPAAPAAPMFHGPRVGEHNHDVMHKLLGLSAAEVDRLMADKVM